MGNCFSDRVAPADQVKFIRSSSGENENVFKLLEKKRHGTDLFFLILICFYYITIVGLLLYCVMYGDIYRVLNGYDSCANICGRGNIRETDLKFACKGIDMKTKRYLLIQNAGGGHNIDPLRINRTCVESCKVHDGYQAFLKRCITESNNVANVNTFFSKLGLKDFFQEAAEDLDLCSMELIYLCLISLVFSIIILIFFRFFVGIVVWLVLIGVVLASIMGTIYSWILYHNSTSNMKSKALKEMVSEIDSRKNSSLLALAIIVTIVTLIVILIVIVLRKRIKLTIQLFREAGKAVGDMPMLLLEPLVTFVVIAVIILIWIYACLWIQSSGHLTFIAENQFQFIKDDVMKVTRWLNLFAGLWMIQFIIGCEYMVIAGAVATWYFTRNRSRLGYPILYSVYNLIRYHLGSVALGSLIIAVIQFIRIILSILQKYLKSSQSVWAQKLLKCCACCFYCFEKILKFINRNAYIEIAMYGQSFCSSGKQAFRILASNALRVAAINSVGDFVLIMGKVLVVLATVLIGVKILEDKEGLQHMWVPLALIGIFAYFVAHCFLSVYEMAIDTIFLCFCEDCEQNDGHTKPYFMSKGLMKFVESSNKALLYANQSGNSNSNAWDDGRPYTISGHTNKM